MKITALLSVVLLTFNAAAQNIDLSTVPARDSVQLTIYNNEDITLVRETRVITFRRGNNPLQFSWANTLIDPTSVELTFQTDPDKLSVVDTIFPHDKPQQLTWNVRSEIDGQATVEITYFTSGIAWAADYVGIVHADEAAMKVEGFVTITNRSGEDYADAQIRLVVGQINLVEKIAELARRGVITKPTSAPMLRQRKDEILRESMVGLSRSAAGNDIMPARIIKEGLSEYFIFTIDGRQTIPDQWSKRLRSFKPTDAPLAVQYRYRPREYGNQLVKVLLLTNDTPAGLGDAPLPDGQFRIFRDTAHDGLGYIAEQPIRYIPIGDKIELNVGADPNVIFELTADRVYRDQLWLRIQGINVLRRADEPGVRIEDTSRVVGWNTHTIYTQTIRNQTGRPIDVEIRRSFHGDITFTSGLAATAYDADTVEYTFDLDPGQKKDATYRITQREGTNAKQNRVKVIEGGVL